MPRPVYQGIDTCTQRCPADMGYHAFETMTSMNKDAHVAVVIWNIGVYIWVSCKCKQSRPRSSAPDVPPNLYMLPIKHHRSCSWRRHFSLCYRR